MATTCLDGKSNGNSGFNHLKIAGAIFKWPDQCEEDRQSRILFTREIALHAIPRDPLAPAGSPNVGWW
jgi:hypothetical protein